MATLNIDPKDLNAYGDKFGSRIREAIAEQYPDEQTAQAKVEPTTIERILLDPNVVPPPVRIKWQTEIRRNEGFTLVHAMLWVFVALLLIPGLALFAIYESVAPGMGVMIVVATIAFLAGKARRQKGWGKN